MAPSRSSPGTGQLFLSSSSKTAPAQFTHLSGTYPLKLLAPTPLPSQPSNFRVCYMLAYGGGLVAGDAISLHGSTKVFKTRAGLRPPLARRDGGSDTKGAGATATSEMTRQRLLVHLEPGSLLLLLPDPIQPFKSSSYIQSQRFIFPAPSSPDQHTASPPANALILDWYTSGRNNTQSSTSKYQEEWEFDVYSSMNEIVYASPTTALPSVQPPNEHPAHVSGNTIHTSASPSVSPPIIPFMHEKVTLTNTPPTTTTTSSHATNNSTGTPLQTRMRPYQTYATLLIHGPLLAPLTTHLAALANSQRERQFQGNKPDTLVWSFSTIAAPREGVHFFRRAGPDPVDEHSGGSGGDSSKGGTVGGTGILRVAGTETERVKLWIEEALVVGQVRDLVGDALWQRVF
ncbi:hypothetical protein QFC21_002438 [Naganishia friedmannii]|uniref:Uncharacterized protein n=1 Tax=Naganishia friedmannii TaxID=89922 RepID=A0ACC2VWY4_9TREE|nr:hypothetical protein QFC21_002438 [Naganishia friedmannii]